MRLEAGSNGSALFDVVGMLANVDVDVVVWRITIPDEMMITSPHDLVFGLPCESVI